MKGHTTTTILGNCVGQSQQTVSSDIIMHTRESQNKGKTRPNLLDVMRIPQPVTLLHKQFLDVFLLVPKGLKTKVWNSYNLPKALGKGADLQTQKSPRMHLRVPLSPCQKKPVHHSHGTARLGPLLTGLETATVSRWLFFF